jgi:SAM-dependent methyltransferase
MAAFDLGRQFHFIFVGSNSMLHLHRISELLGLLSSVKRHLSPGGRFAFDIFNPDIRFLARSREERMPFKRLLHPRWGMITVEHSGTYDAEAQVDRSTWYISTTDRPDFLVLPLDLREIFPEELRALLQLGGFTLLDRFGDFDRTPFDPTSHRQVCLATVM